MKYTLDELKFIGCRAEMRNNFNTSYLHEFCFATVLETYAPPSSYVTPLYILRLLKFSCNIITAPPSFMQSSRLLYSHAYAMHPIKKYCYISNEGERPPMYIPITK